MNDRPATEDLQSRVERLEELYSEQDYTILALNESLAQQDRELTSLALRLEQLQDQLKSLRGEESGDVDPGFEPPPHY